MIITLLLTNFIIKYFYIKDLDKSFKCIYLIQLTNNHSIVIKILFINLILTPISCLSNNFQLLIIKNLIINFMIEATLFSMTNEFMLLIN